MSKIKLIGKGFIQIGEVLFNLNQYKKIEKYTFGIEEDPDGNAYYGIVVTPLIPNAESLKNGVDGSVFIATYGENEIKEFYSDFDLIIASLKDII